MGLTYVVEIKQPIYLFEIIKVVEIKEPMYLREIVTTLGKHLEEANKAICEDVTPKTNVIC